MHGHVHSAHCQHSFHAMARQDPTKTTGLRSRYERDAVRRVRSVSKEAKAAINGTSDEGDFSEGFDFPNSDRKVQAFMRWIRSQQDKKVLEVISGTPVERAAARSWQNIYLRSAYQKGLAQAASSMKAGGVKVSDRWLDSAFFRPIHADRVGLIYTRAYSELQGITAAVDTQVSRILAQGVMDGRGVQSIANDIAEGIDSIGINRARVLARTEVIRTHAESTLNSYEEAGLEGVEVQSEFTTAGDNRVCPQCSALEGRVFSLAEARGIIPVHPNCRCAWLPVIDGAGLSL